MTKRLTEAGLREIEALCQPYISEPEAAGPMLSVSGQFVFQFVNEIRRLRGLILRATERHGEVNLTMLTGWGDGETALMEEAQAIREEQAG